MKQKLKIDIKHNVGTCKYLVSYSFGNKQHKDGSEFFDIAMFKSKKAMHQFITDLHLKQVETVK